MNSDQVQGNLKQVMGSMREKWGKLTNDDLQQAAGKKDQLLGKLQERYGYTREQAEREMEDFNRAHRNLSNVA
jgi:uncharacterized protein YjbJ (UPF0337 family)